MNPMHNPGLTRKVVKSGDSLVITIPSQLAQMCGIEKSDLIEFTYLGPSELRLKRVEPE